MKKILLLLCFIFLCGCSIKEKQEMVAISPTPLQEARVEIPATIFPDTVTYSEYFNSLKKATKEQFKTYNINSDRIFMEMNTLEYEALKNSYIHSIDTIISGIIQDPSNKIISDISFDMEQKKLNVITTTSTYEPNLALPLFPLFQPCLIYLAISHQTDLDFEIVFKNTSDFELKTIRYSEMKKN